MYKRVEYVIIHTRCPRQRGHAKNATPEQRFAVALPLLAGVLLVDNRHKESEDDNGNQAVVLRSCGQPAAESRQHQRTPLEILFSPVEQQQ